jgi:hypothetical protein
MKRRTVMILIGVLAVGGLGASLDLAVLFSPFEQGPRYKGMPVSYWRQEVHSWERISSSAGPSTLAARLKSHLGFRDKNGVPAVLGDDPEATPVLLQLLRDDDIFVRERAFHALRHIDGNELRSGLMSLFNSGKKNDRTFAARGTIWAARVAPWSQAWSRLSLRMAMPVLIESLKDKTDPDRAASALFLGYIGHDAKSAVPALLVVLTDPNDAIRHQAAEALINIDPDAAKKAGMAWADHPDRLGASDQKGRWTRGDRDPR